MRPSDSAAPQAATRSERVSRAAESRPSPREAVCALGRTAEHVQAVADAHVLEVAEPCVESDQRLLRRLVRRRAFLEQSRFAPSFEDQRRNRARPARIERLRFGEFVEEPLELERGPMRSSGDQGRRQVADRRRADAALGLRSFAGIVDDERIDDRRRADEDFGRAGFAQRDRLAGQPFHRAVGAELDDRVDFLVTREPEMERDIAVARRQVEVVVVALARSRVAPVGLRRDDERTQPDEPKAEGIADRIAVIGRLAPGGEKRPPEVGRRRGEFGLVFGQRQCWLERSFRKRRR